MRMLYAVRPGLTNTDAGWVTLAMVRSSAARLVRRGVATARRAEGLAVDWPAGRPPAYDAGARGGGRRRTVRHDEAGVGQGGVYDDGSPGSPECVFYRITPARAYGYGADGLTATRWRFAA